MRAIEPLVTIGERAASTGTYVVTARWWTISAPAGFAAWLAFVAPLAAEEQPAATPPSATTPAAGTADQEVNAANNPLTPKITVNIQDYFTPVLNREPGRQSNEFLLRGVLPLDTGGVPQLLRVTLPTLTNPTFPNGNATGLGDFSIYDLVILPIKGITVSVGPVLVVPTATSPDTGAGKWQAGAATFVVAQHSWGLTAGLVTYQHSFAGDPSRPLASTLTAQPIFTYNLPGAFYLRSTGIWSFDLGGARHTSVIPLGFGIGKVWSLGNLTLNLFAEPQYSVIRSGIGVPTWQIFAGFNIQIALHPK
jgi:hypothetical protein